MGRAERLQDPKFLAALEKQYPKSKRDEAQVQITILQEENERQRGVIEMLMERCRWLQEESGTLYGALEAAPEPPPKFGEQLFWREKRYRVWYNGECGTTESGQQH